MNTFYNCGLYNGQETLGWEDGFQHHLERNDIEESLDKNDYDYVKKVLESYKKKAQGEITGVKLTYFSERIWDRLNPILNDVFPGYIKISTLKHPLAIYKRKVKNDIFLLVEEELSNWESLYSFRLKLIKEGFRFIRFPQAFESFYIVKIVEDLGLKWDKKVFLNPSDDLYTFFNPKKANRNGVSSKEFCEFKESYPNIDEQYWGLCNYLL